MNIKNHEASDRILASEEDTEIRRSMGLMRAMILEKQGFELEEHEEIDLVVFMKVAQAFFKKKHLLHAHLDSELSPSSWWPDDV